MIFFKKKTEELYLVTNFKVMFSTLMEQESLERVPLSVGLILKLFLNCFHLNKTPFYLLVRDPYARLESFFKNKFRSTISKIQNTEKWQYCHEIFFSHIRLDTTMSPAVIAEKLQGLTFPTFISLLPATYRKDGHLHPQHWMTSLQVGKWNLGIGMPIKFKAIFKMESEKDRQKMAALFQLNLNIKENTTESVDVSINWTQEEYHLVNKLYNKDFSYFFYEKKIASFEKW